MHADDQSALTMYAFAASARPLALGTVPSACLGGRLRPEPLSQPPNIFNRGRGLLLLGFVNNVFCRLLGRRFATIRDSRRRPLHRLIRRPVVGGSLRGGGDIPGSSIF